jgi:hypothetical protein
MKPIECSQADGVTLDGVLDWILDLLTTFNTQLVITLNYSVIVNFHILQITKKHVMTFLACSVFTSNCLVTTLIMAVPLLPC